MPAETPFLNAAEVEAWAADPSIDGAQTIAAVEPDDTAIIIYTSGTTGRAKGAMITHGNLAAIGAQLGEAWHWQTTDTLLIMLPLFHVHACAPA